MGRNSSSDVFDAPEIARTRPSVGGVSDGPVPVQKLSLRFPISERMWGYSALLSILLIWLLRMYSTWATWGSPTIDCGREVYVPAMLAKGRTLYKDIYYLYFPAAPYFNSFLFRLFGTHLEVTYISGSLAALGSAVFLYLSGTRLGSRLAGWVTAIVVLLQAFEQGIFNFAFPYSFGSA